MRFYSRITAALCLNAISAVIWIVLGCSGMFHGSIAKLLALIYSSFLFAAAAGQFLTYWELHPDALYERRLWQTRTIPFDQIAAIKAESPAGKPAPGWLKVLYKSPFPFFETGQNALDRGTLLLAPAHRSELLSALRHAAPQATFEAL